MDMLVIITAIAFYCLPMIVALSRAYHPQAGAIAVLNLLLGWTVLGWVGALVWACISYEQPRNIAPYVR